MSAVGVWELGQIHTPTFMLGKVVRGNGKEKSLLLGVYESCGCGCVYYSAFLKRGFALFTSVGAVNNTPSQIVNKCHINTISLR